MSRIVTKMKRLVPPKIKTYIKNSPLMIRHRSQAENLYHCSVYRTGSQWLRRILSDRRVFRYSGLDYKMYFQRIFGTLKQPDETVDYDTFPFTEPFPLRRIVGLYAGYDHFLRIPRPVHHKTFFIARDPRDITVSHYFASRRDAREMNSPHWPILTDPVNGIFFMMDHLYKMGLFSALGSWAEIKDKPNVLLLRFEDLIGPRQINIFHKLFDYCDIAMPDRVLQHLLADYGFRAMSGGRRPGQEDTDSHYRKGVSGDWRNHFTAAHEKRFQSITGDLISRWGYDREMPAY